MARSYSPLIRSHGRVIARLAASNSSSHPEVGGDAAAYFDATNIQEMAATIWRLLSNRDEFDRRRQLGLEQAQKFSWQRAAAETMEVYERVLQ